MAGRVDVERHEDRRLKLAGKRLHVLLCLLVEIGDGDLRSQRAECLAQPQAMDLSLAIPTIRPFRPSCSLVLYAGICSRPLVKVFNVQRR